MQVRASQACPVSTACCGGVLAAPGSRLWLHRVHSDVQQIHPSLGAQAPPPGLGCGIVTHPNPPCESQSPCTGLPDRVRGRGVTRGVAGDRAPSVRQPWPTEKVMTMMINTIITIICIQGRRSEGARPPATPRVNPLPPDAVREACTRGLRLAGWVRVGCNPHPIAGGDA